MSRRRIGQEAFGFAVGRRVASSLDDLAGLIDWAAVDQALVGISCAAKGEPAWPPLALFKAMLLSICYDLSDVTLAEALDDRASFRRSCGFSRSKPKPERTAFVRFRRSLVAHGLDKPLFDVITGQLKAGAIRVKTGTLVDATIVPLASEDDGEGHWLKHLEPNTCPNRGSLGPQGTDLLSQCSIAAGGNVNGTHFPCAAHYAMSCGHEIVVAHSPAALDPRDPGHTDCTNGGAIGCVGGGCTGNDAYDGLGRDAGRHVLLPRSKTVSPRLPEILPSRDRLHGQMRSRHDATGIRPVSS
ncbi:transposase [Rhizobium sp. TRM95111]|uniref:transposase n=1 Tax=Rhizobium alarense TaxID=2846851 RepID=UPI001F269876|nr:transposase [Rhizobium alarense]MCF3639649.1 transposase [Rhizobium alarense]